VPKVGSGGNDAHSQNEPYYVTAIGFAIASLGLAGLSMATNRHAKS
jgi:hypothetical protein